MSSAVHLHQLGGGGEGGGGGGGGGGGHALGGGQPEGSSQLLKLAIEVETQQ